METAAYFSEKARQCRRLVRSTNDERAIQGLTALAEEFEAKAVAVRGTDNTIDLLGDGSPGRLVQSENADPT